ncbi:Calcium-activated potassium channel subunit alpha-1 [Gracilariopsis chorda]|uniref:Calcium-activated potassium channel subunit alpha-1 n=1 Tax=Gracilariopsis chorda TaxID=448386 RepID=A0A2V3IIW1_9FLOR|nr:Calcium-activated potassium channel subunit alpha-1 [Gracilariopsis chorda]|eukprot:PXF42034.1 Calcium-activated potassium channel subunit alpha-1 [Gracilariopsis chorda]
MTFSPPPWADVGRLLLYGCYFYIALFFLAATVSYSYSIPIYLSRRFEGVFSGVNNMLDSSGMDKVFFSRSFTFGVLRMFVSTIICIIYVYSTYAGHINIALLAFQKFVAIILLLNVVYKVLFATRPVSYILGFETTMDVFSLASLLMAKQTDWLNFSFLQAYVILSRYFQIEPTLEIFFMVKSSPFHRQLTRLALEFVVFIYVFASGLQLFEQLGEPWETLIGTTFDLTLANSFYFTVVTIFTVGYGDFVPFTLLGRLWIIFIIVFGAYLVTRKIGQVVDVVSGLRRGLGSFVKTEGTDHCVICGNVKWEYLKAFVLEFYGDDRNTKTKLVIICDQPNWSETVWNNFFTSNIQFRDHVTYLEGSCVTRDDLIRAQVETSKAVFILCNQHNPNPYAEDSETLKRILTIRSYTPNLPIYSMCALRDSMLQITFALEQTDEQEEGEEGLSRRTSGVNLRSQMDPSTSDIIGVSALVDEHSPNLGDFEDEDDDDDGLLVTSYDGSSDLKSEAICMQEIEMSLLAKNVFCNGLSTLLANLILRVNPILKDEDPMWAWEYKLGTECRFEYVKLPMQLTNRKFVEIALTMYDYGVIPIATKRFMEKKWRAVTPDTIIHLNSIALIITFHSTNYLDTVMSEIASRITETFSDTVSMSSLQDIPPFDDQQHRARRAGDILTGDLTVEYHYVDDSDGELHRGHLEQERSPSHSGENASGNQDETPSEMTPREQTGQLVSTARGPLGITTSEASPSGAASSGIPYSGTEKQSGYAEVKDVGDGVSVVISAIAPVRSAPAGSSIPTQMRSQDRMPLVITRTDSAQHLAALSNASNDQGMLQQPTIPFREAELQKAAEDAPITMLLEAKTQTNPRVDRIVDVREPSQPEEKTGTLSYTVGGPSTDIRFSVAQAGSSSDGRGLGMRQEMQQAIDEGPLARRPGARHVSFQNQASGAERKVAKRSSSKARPRRGEYPQQGAVVMVHGDQQLPMKLSGHIVVCTIGRMGLQNLGYFLHQVNVERSFSKGKAPVVAICSRLTEEEEADLEVYASNGHTRDVRTKKQTSSAVAESGRHQPSLVVIQGNSMSVKTLRRAQFEKAKAVVILACEDVNDIDHMDAKAIFTVMTLDHLLGEDSETFVCTMLDAEESMQLLRAPRHPRRRGALLGRLPEENMELAIMSPRADGSRRRMTSKNRFASFPSQFRDLRDSTQRFPSRTLSYGAITSTGRVPRSVSFIGDRHLQGDFMYPSQNTFGGREGSSSSFGAFQRIREDEDGALMQNPSLAGDSAFRILLGPSANNGEGGEALRDETGRLRAMNGLRHGFRDESFEKQRYASGEMMISSTYMSLLIREFTMPGLIAVVRKIFGATIGKNTKPKRSWIRAVSIPENWIREKEERTYREVFEVLIGYGAIALGLYRSGNVNVRVQFMAGSDCSSAMYSSRTSSLGSMRGTDDGIATNAEESFDDPPASMRGFGGDVPSQAEGAEDEQSSLLHTRSTARDLGGYGAIGNRRGYLGGYEFGQSDGGESDISDRGDGGRIPPELFRVAESVVSGRAPSSYGEWANDYGEEVHRKYTCPSSRRTTRYKELAGGDNVLPYVYTNPEAFTLVSNNDAVYVLVSPNVQLPEEW